MLEYYQKKVFGSSKIGGVFELRLFESCLFVLQVLKKMFHNSYCYKLYQKSQLLELVSNSLSSYSRNLACSQINQMDAYWKTE